MRRYLNSTKKLKNNEQKKYFLRFLKAGRRKIILSTIAASTLFPISSAIAQNGNYANISTYAMQTLKSATLDNTKKPDITSFSIFNNKYISFEIKCYAIPTRF